MHAILASALTARRCASGPPAVRSSVRLTLATGQVHVCSWCELPTSSIHYCPSWSFEPHARLRRLASLLELGGVQRIGEKHCDRHRTNAARYWRDPARALARGLEVDVADELSFRVPIDADVDDDRA